MGFKKGKGKKSLFSKFSFKESDDMFTVSGGRRQGKSFQIIILDELFYEECFNKSNHKCEECNTQLPTEFRNSEEKVIARWRYSHIIPKSIAFELRHVIKNINHLCLKCHTKWDFGDKKSMKIYSTNKKIFPNYLK